MKVTLDINILEKFEGGGELTIQRVVIGDKPHVFMEINVDGEIIKWTMPLEKFERAMRAI